MKRQERKIYCRCIAIMAVYIIAGVWFYTMPCDAKIAPLEAVAESDGNFIEESGEVAKNAQIRENTAMLRKVGEVEQTASEEETALAEALVAEKVESIQEDDPITQDLFKTESAVETSYERNVTLYSFGDQMIEPYLQTMLYEALDRHGISYWYEIGLCQIWQESKGNIYVVNASNGIDSGILQYRATYWDWTRGDLFSPEAQFDLYAEQMSARLNQGLSEDECISRHKTSDYSTAVDWGYVQEVRQHLPNLRKVKS